MTPHKEQLTWVLVTGTTAFHMSSVAAIAFLHGIACKELTVTQLDTRQPGFDVTMAVGAIKN